MAKRTIPFFIILFCSTLARAEIPEPEVRQAWVSFKTVYNRTYPDSETEQKALGIFRANLESIEVQNDENEAANGQRPLGVTQFADMTPEEFQATHMGLNSNNVEEALRDASPVNTFGLRDANSLPQYIDYRGTLTTAVKDQGQCGSCWSYSVAESIESEYAIKHNTKPPVLSEQQILDCDYTGDTQGCNGGFPYSAYSYTSQYGLQSEASYPYLSGDTGGRYRCRYNAAAVVAKTKKYVVPVSQCPGGDGQTCAGQAAKEPVLAAMVATYGPVGISVNASPWQFYKGGVLARCSGGLNDLNHAVQLVGYSTDPNRGAAYWLVRNSWSEKWGEAGYIRLAMGHNTCGLADETHIPVVE